MTYRIKLFKKSPGKLPPADPEGRSVEPVHTSGFKSDRFLSRCIRVLHAPRPHPCPTPAGHPGPVSLPVWWPTQKQPQQAVLCPELSHSPVSALGIAPTWHLFPDFKPILLPILGNCLQQLLQEDRSGAGLSLPTPGQPELQAPGLVPDAPRPRPGPRAPSSGRGPGSWSSGR